GFLVEQGLLEQATIQQTTLPQTVLYAAALYDVNRHDQLQAQHSLVASNASQVSTYTNPWQTLGPWRMVGGTRTLSYQYQGQEYTVALSASFDNAQSWTIQIGTQPAEHVSYLASSDGQLLLRRMSAADMGNVGTGKDAERSQVQVFVQQQQYETLVAFAGQVY